jgi:16S rRNA G966 N2-methylase RsmD
MEMVDRGRILALDVFRALDSLATEAAEFDLVFVDAPYRNDLSHEVLQCLSRLGLAAAGGWIVVGQSKRAPSAPEAPQGLTRQSIVTIGDHRIAFYRRPPEAAPSGS